MCTWCAVSNLACAKFWNRWRTSSLPGEKQPMNSLDAFGKCVSPLEAPIHTHTEWSCSVMSDSATPWTVAHQAPPSMGFSRQEYWSGLPVPCLQKSTTLHHTLVDIQRKPCLTILLTAQALPRHHLCLSGLHVLSATWTQRLITVHELSYLPLVSSDLEGFLLSCAFCDHISFSWFWTSTFF